MPIFTVNELSETHSDITYTVQTTQFTNKLVVFLKVNGEADTSYAITKPDQKTLHELISGTVEDSLIFDKTLLIGLNDLKLSVLVNHVARLIYTNGETRDLIITMSSKIFGKEGKSNDDLEKIVVLCGIVKKLIQ